MATPTPGKTQGIFEEFSLEEFMNSNTSMSSLLFKLGLAALVAVFAISIKQRETIRWLFFDSSTYHQTSGVITESRIYHTGVRGGWSFSITYEYVVDGEKYDSDRVHFGYQASSDISYAQGFVNKYPVGETVSVYYDPDDLSQAVLEPEIKWFGLLYYLAGYLLLSLILFLVSVYSSRKNK